MDSADIKLLSAAQEMLEALWIRAMNNEASLQEIKAIRSGCVAIAVVKHGVERVGPFPGWDA